jgi:hypothetical protein
MLTQKRGKKSEEKRREYNKGRKKGAKKEGKKATVNDLYAARHCGDQKILSRENGPRTIMYDLQAEYNLR